MNSRLVGLCLCTAFCLHGHLAAAKRAADESFNAPGIARVVTNTNDGGPDSLRQALLEAVDGDTIEFQIPTSDPGYAAGVWTITLTSGELLVSKNIAINGIGADALVVRRSSGASDFRIFHVGPNITVVIQGLTVSNGRASGPGNLGGGLYNERSSVTLANCHFTGNQASGGGGVVNSGRAQGAATMHISGCSLTANISNYGGGLLNDGSGSSVATVTVVNSTFSGNTSGVFGGGPGFYNDGSQTGMASAQISNSTFTENSGLGTIVNSGSGGGSAVLEIGNTILKAGSTNSGNFGGINGTVISRGYNLASDGASGLLSGAGDMINLDPILGPLKNNGGPTPTHSTLSNSPALDRGRRDAIPALSTDLDQRGRPRPVTYDTAIVPAADRSDIGAVELAPGVQPISAVSRKVHGPAGEFDVPLTLTGPVAIEGRSGGGTAPPPSGMPPRCNARFEPRCHAPRRSWA